MSGVDDRRRATDDNPLVGIAEIEGRGRSLVASHPLKPGQILLTDSPILLYSALPLKQPPPLHHYCSHCFRLLHPSTAVVSCPSCSSLFCNPNCQSLSLSSSHSPWVCQSLTHLKDRPPPPLLHHLDRQVQARFLISAYNLAAVSPSNFRILLSLQGESPPQPDDSTLFLHSLISSLSPPPVAGFGFSVELTAALLAKDKLNSFGLMEPFSEEGDRSVRAYGIYPKASFFNHDCLPNACRFDYVDTAADWNTDIVVRAIHDVPQGREICLSYFPVNLTYSERQKRLRDDYGFTCGCDRCKVEANWSEDEEGGGVEEEEAMDEDGDDEYMENSEAEEEGGGGVTGDDDFPHSYFFVRYMCDRKNCWGTLAPLPPTDSSTPSTVMECNVCGSLKNDEATIDGDALDE